MISNRVAQLRRDRGMMQSELATLAGVRPETMSRIEAGFQIPSYATARAIAKALGMEADYEPVPHSHYDFFHRLRQTRAYMHYSIYTARGYLEASGIRCDVSRIFGEGGEDYGGETAR